MSCNVTYLRRRQERLAREEAGRRDRRPAAATPQPIALPAAGGMHHEDIKAAIRKNGETLASIAAMVDGKPVTKGAVSRVLRGEFKSAAIAAAIAEVVGLAPSALWPSLYARSTAAARPARSTKGPA